MEMWGLYRKIVGQKVIRFHLSKPTRLQRFIEELCASLGPRFKSVFLDPELGDPRPNSLIVVNGKEVSAIDGLDTRIKGGDVITIIPITHGG